MGGVASRDNFEQILKRLSGEDVDPADHHFWDEMWKTTLAAEVTINPHGPDLPDRISFRSLLQILFVNSLLRGLSIFRRSSLKLSHNYIRSVSLPLFL
jgi:hypothetical protein